MKRIRVIVVDDHKILRSGIRMLINAQPDMNVIGEAGNIGEAVEEVRALQPDVVSLDISMPGGTGIQGIKRITEVCSGLRILILTMHDDPAYIRSTMAAGAAGYLLKTAADTELLSAIRAVDSGRVYLSVQVPGSTTRAVLPSASIPDMPKLTAREVEVLQFLARGHSYQEIADSLWLSIKTVETYRTRLSQKLGLRKRAELVKYALAIGLLNDGNQSPMSENT